MDQFSFNLRVINFHEAVIKNYVSSIAMNRFNIKEGIGLSYDLQKGELYVDDKPKKSKDKPSKGRSK